MWLPHMLKVARLLSCTRFMLCTRRSRGTAHEGGGCEQSVWSTVCDGIVCSWLWPTETRSSPLGYFSRLLHVVDNWPHIICRFSTGRLIEIEDFTFFLSEQLKLYLILISLEYYPIVGNTLHRDTENKKYISDELSTVRGSIVPQIIHKYV